MDVRVPSEEEAEVHKESLEALADLCRSIPPGDIFCTHCGGWVYNSEQKNIAGEKICVCGFDES